MAEMIVDNAVVIEDAWQSDGIETMCRVCADYRRGNLLFLRASNTLMLEIGLYAWLQIAKSVDLAVQYPQSPIRLITIPDALAATFNACSYSCTVYALPDAQVLIFEVDAAPILKIPFGAVERINRLWPDFPCTVGERAVQTMVAQPTPSPDTPGHNHFPTERMHVLTSSTPFPIVLHVATLLTLAIEAGFIDPDDSGPGTLLEEITLWINANSQGHKFDTRPLLARIAPAMADTDYVWHGRARVLVASHGLRIYVADPPAALQGGEFEASIFLQRKAALHEPQ